MTKNPPPEQFSTQIRSLFEKSDWPAARALLIAHLPDGWTGLYGLLAMTHMHVQPRSQADCDLALEWLEKGVLHDEPDSLAVLGRVLMSGELGKQNPERGIHLLQKAAQANVLMAVLTLLKIHEQGVENFLEPDLVLAAHCLRQAAELGDPACAYRLAVKLQQEGQDPVDVFRYYDKAAQGGMEQAMHNVGVC
ncbi:MAG TPA: tetratricopeptide repeat protein, partial [Limnobacter sp.]|nr:tetratricopeptide repeat protein [Limnobacter sp.]